MAALATLLLLLTACSGSSVNETTVSGPDAAADDTSAPAPTTAEGNSPSSPEPETGPASSEGQTVSVLDPGTAPRTVLAVEAPDTTTLVVVSADSDETVIGGDRRMQDRTATFELLVAVDPEGSGFRLVAEPTLESIEMPDPPDLSRLAPLVTTYDRNGIQVGPTSSKITDLTQATDGLLSTPGLVLAVPETPVGVGARWSVAISPDGSSQAFVTVIDVSADGIDVEVVFESASDEATFSMISSGTYDRNSLVAQSVRTVVTMVIDTTVSANGEIVQVNDSRQSVRTYEQVGS